MSVFVFLPLRLPRRAYSAFFRVVGFGFKELT
jgi:hypothetical protein